MAVGRQLPVKPLVSANRNHEAVARTFDASLDGEFTDPVAI
jgi:hypothetical protein